MVVSLTFLFISFCVHIYLFANEHRWNESFDRYIT